jgi:hypothetical protein
MRTISLRQFRDSIGDWAEPVIVQRRTADGSFEVLGEWHPNFVQPPSVGELAPKDGPLVVERFSTRPFTPVPKRATRG